MAQVLNSLMSPTPYSPEPKFKTAVQELRIYDAMPGKLPDLHNRFKNHTMPLFEKHGIENVAYWTEDVGTSNRLVYMLGYPDLGRPREELDRLPERLRLAEGPRRLRGKRIPGAGFHPLHPPPHPLLAPLAGK